MTSPKESKSTSIYADERDESRFWSALQLAREPARLRWYLPLIVLLVLGSVPWYLPEGYVGAVVGGLPIWIWISLGCSFGLSVTVAAAVLRHWRDPGDGGA